MTILYMNDVVFHELSCQIMTKVEEHCPALTHVFTSKEVNTIDILVTVLNAHLSQFADFQQRMESWTQV